MACTFAEAAQSLPNGYIFLRIHRLLMQNRQDSDRADPQADSNLLCSYQVRRMLYNFRTVQRQLSGKI